MLLQCFTTKIGKCKQQSVYSFCIVLQTMFASSSSYLLFKPYFFHDYGQENCLCDVSYFGVKDAKNRAMAITFAIDYKQLITKIHIIFCLFAIHMEVKHIHIQRIVYWFLSYWVVNKICNIIYLR